MARTEKMAAALACMALLLLHGMANGRVEKDEAMSSRYPSAEWLGGVVWRV